MARGNVDADVHDAIGRARAGEYLLAITAGSIIRFSDKMLIQYIKKQNKYGHSWLNKPLIDSEYYVLEHLRDHWKHLVEEEEAFDDEGLIGLALMAMMIVQSREIQKKQKMKLKDIKVSKKGVDGFD